MRLPVFIFCSVVCLSVALLPARLEAAAVDAATSSLLQSPGAAFWSGTARADSSVLPGQSLPDGYAAPVSSSVPRADPHDPASRPIDPIPSPEAWSSGLLVLLGLGVYRLIRRLRFA